MATHPLLSAPLSHAVPAAEACVVAGHDEHRAHLEAHYHALGVVPPWKREPEILEMVLVKGEYRPLGVISTEELQELERAHEDGDIRAEDTLRLIQEGRRPP